MLRQGKMVKKTSFRKIISSAILGTGSVFICTLLVPVCIFFMIIEISVEVINKLLLLAGSN